MAVIEIVQATMRHSIYLAFSAALLSVASHAQTPPPQTISDQNSSLSFTRSEPNEVFPFSLAQKLEWTVDGRRILVYPSNPSVYINVRGHLHGDAHVAANQMHAQGPMLGYDPTATSGGVTGGIVYTVVGGAAGSGVSRIYEKVDLFNKTDAAIPVTLGGLGWKPTGTGAHDQDLPVPDLTGLEVTGSTIAFVQGNGYKDPQGFAHTGSITDLPSTGYTRIPDNASASYASVTVLPITTFNGFNPFLQDYSLPAGATLTMITELNVRPDASASTPAGSTGSSTGTLPGTANGTQGTTASPGSATGSTGTPASTPLQ